MRINRLVFTALLGLGGLTLNTGALAGGCGGGMPCSTGVVVNQTPAHYGPMTVNVGQPFGHLRQVQYNRAPNVSITRIHSMGPTAGLSDAPSGFTGGCFPTSTAYCRGGAPAPIPMIAAPRPVPMIPSVRTVAVAPATNPALLQPRQYGTNTFTPGTAYLPTSIVNRNPAAAQAVLNSGQTVPQKIVSGGTAPGFGVASTVTTQRSTAPNMASGIQADGTYWEQVSGPTMVNGMMATKIICKRQAQRRVVRPVIGVRYPVPVPVTAPAPIGCAAPAMPGLAGGPVPHRAPHHGSAPVWQY